ncbi:DNA helicase [Pedobacter psychrodurus]|uniref:DNA 3'-5' helicase II n=1 Tax=Pedobacter psychrodurus TaxID=2530456 RepID=A0A4R0Q123_9SPHI|nr:ATP-binding domain-containing protein [Pedobacter psychrodurus]TCD26320.1 DNA helicase [Pedobacter psychrodurus]
MSSYFYLQAEKNSKNADLLNRLGDYADYSKELIYVLNKPLGDVKYNYAYKSALIILAPKSKILFLDYGNNNEAFENFIEDVIEDVGSISDKFLYKDVIGRPRNWRTSLVETDINFKDITSIDTLFDELKINDESEKKKVDLLISLFIGSINDIERVKETVPLTTLDKVKQKIQLFDGDQTRFVYQKPQKKKIRIQGLSGTGKTELLLHKLKDLYTTDNSSTIFFTCHNKILADNLKKRIPSFFNFMKVEQQIEWETRLWCAHAWGSNSSPNSGAYRYICSKYQIPYYRYSYQMSFSKACSLACQDIREKFKDSKMPFAFNYMFIDESQDFDINFIELCDLVTENNIYIAGDIFQSIFDAEISSSIAPDFLLGKCYRTDPKTLMFAHALGMGLFEDTKLRWLEKKEWEDCGYNVYKDEEEQLHLSREPLRRFEDVEESFESIQLIPIKEKASDTVINILKKIIAENPTASPDDIGIILLDHDKEIYKLADVLEFKINLELKWDVNKAYESKEKLPKTILISNRNNVKGLEFPFVICISKKITKDPSYRNSLYTMLTRSFIKSYFVVPPTTASGLTQKMVDGLKQILKTKEMVIKEPSTREKKLIRTRFEYNLKNISHYDLMKKIFDLLKVEKKYHDKLIKISQEMDMGEEDEDTLVEFVKDNIKYIKD